MTHRIVILFLTIIMCGWIVVPMLETKQNDPEALNAPTEAALKEMADQQQAEDIPVIISGHIGVKDMWVKPPLKGKKITAGFLTIGNYDPENSAFLQEVSSPIAGRIEIHETIEENNIFKMRAMDSLEITPRGQQNLEPGGKHLMIYDLARSLVEGDIIPLTLIFKDGTILSIQAPVRKRY